MTTIVIFGATGDLTKRKLIPALFNLHKQGKLNAKIIAIGRKPLNDESIRSELKQFVKGDWNTFKNLITYHQLEFHDSEAYDALKKKVASDQNRLFYLATAPESFPIIIKQLNRTGIAVKNPKKGWHRVVFEKPFGHDLKSAKQLNKEITTIFNERQIYRIDHYLGKEFVQNILVLRFTNPIFERLWDADHIDNVQIISVESDGVLERGGYYDKSGALRDMVQNHLLQLLSLTAMEIPKSLDADDIRDQKVKALKTIKINADWKNNLVLGQYIAGGKVPDYHKEKDVSQASTTETFVAMKIMLNNKRWKGVPFYVRTGKALTHKYAEIVITFKQLPCRLFCGPTGKLTANSLVIRIQPDEGVELQFNLKEPEQDAAAVPYTMDFSHEAEFGANTPEAYERLLHDVLRGDQTLFTRWDEVEHAWKIVDKLRSVKVPLRPYKAGTHGPAAALDLLKRDSRDWSGNRALRR
jgi:glucose-6-phosphate 1-dehydrogenase